MSIRIESIQNELIKDLLNGDLSILDRADAAELILEKYDYRDDYHDESSGNVLKLAILSNNIEVFNALLAKNSDDNAYRFPEVLDYIADKPNYVTRFTINNIIQTKNYSILKRLMATDSDGNFEFEHVLLGLGPKGLVEIFSNAAKHGEIEIVNKLLELNISDNPNFNFIPIINTGQWKTIFRDVCEAGHTEVFKRLLNKEHGYYQLPNIAINAITKYTDNNPFNPKFDITCLEYATSRSKGTPEIIEILLAKKQ